MNIWLKEVDFTHLKFQEKSDFAKFVKLKKRNIFFFKCKLYDVDGENPELWFNNFLNVDFLAD